jgi:cell division transport system permease protein
MKLSLVLSEAFQGIRRNLATVISVILVTFVSLTFVGAAILLGAQLQRTSDYFQDRAKVDIYMCSEISDTDTCLDGIASDEQIDAVQDKLDSDVLAPLIDGVAYETQQEAHDSMLETFGDELAGLLTVEQTSAVYHVDLKDPEQTPVITDAFAVFAGVEEVTDQLDYLEPIFRGLTIAAYIAVGIAAIMLFSAVLMIGTTIRISAITREREVEIMRFVGASNGTIRTPFVLEGVIAALIGGILASAALIGGMHFGIDGYLAREVTAVPWVSLTDTWYVIPAIILLGVVFAAISGSVASSRALRR